MEIAVQGKYERGSASETFAALADPVRLRIVERLRGSDATVSDLSAELGVAMPSMSKHLNVLQQAGFVTRHVEAQRRRCSLDPEGFGRLAEWMRHYEAVWAGRLSRHETLLDDAEPAGGAGGGA